MHVRGHRATGLRRRALGALLALAWLLGVEVLPALHQAGHDDGAPHDHTPAGTIVTVSFDTAPHDHGDGRVHAHPDTAAREPEVQAADRPRTPRRVPEDTSLDTPAHAHTAVGLAHHLAALHAPPPPELIPAEPDRTSIELARDPDRRLTDTHHAAPRARGPPAVG